MLEIYVRVKKTSLAYDGDRDDANHVGCSPRGIDCQGNTGLSDKYRFWEEEKEDRKANDGIQASQNSTLKKKDTRISKVKSSVSGATGIHSFMCVNLKWLLAMEGVDEKTERSTNIWWRPVLLSVVNISHLIPKQNFLVVISFILQKRKLRIRTTS